MGITGSATIEQVLKRHHANDDFFAVLLSWQLPDMSGIETARQIRRHIGNDIPIIVLSSYDHSEFEEEARKAGINYFITKPLFRSRLGFPVPQAHRKRNRKRRDNPYYAVASH